jgi:hypothetical protein
MQLNRCGARRRHEQRGLAIEARPQIRLMSRHSLAFFLCLFRQHSRLHSWDWRSIPAAAVVLIADVTAVCAVLTAVCAAAAEADPQLDFFAQYGGVWDGKPSGVDYPTRECSASWLTHLHRRLRIRAIPILQANRIHR